MAASPSPPQHTAADIIRVLLDPVLFMAQSLLFLPPTIVRLLLSGRLGTLLSPSRLRLAWFSAFWARVGAGVRETGEGRVGPLLEGLVSSGRLLGGGDESMHGRLAGTVLETGPGTGLWVSLLLPPGRGPAGRRRSIRGAAPITKIYGVEPNCHLHAALRQSIAAAGLQDVYDIVPLGIEDLAAAGRVPSESVDCIVSILCLCSIPDPALNIKQLYGYLKPGGRWYVYEHVRCESERLRECGLFMRVYQAFLNLFWPHIIGGCQLCRNTAKMLREAGPWADIDIEQPEGEPWYHPLPHILGVLTK